MPGDIPRHSFGDARIGLVADIHHHPGAGPSLPDALIEAFRGLDLIVPLGDTGEAEALDLLAEVAPVLATRGQDDPEADPRIAPARVIEAGGLVIGATFDLTRAAGIETDPRLAFPPKPLDLVLRGAFGEPLDVVVFGATHAPLVAHREGVLLVNPGSPTLAPRHTAAVLELRDGLAAVELVDLPG